MITGQKYRCIISERKGDVERWEVKQEKGLIRGGKALKKTGWVGEPRRSEARHNWAWATGGSDTMDWMRKHPDLWEVVTGAEPEVCGRG